MKTLIASLTLCAFAAFAAPVFAEDTGKCNAENLEKAIKDVLKITNQAVMTAALQDLTLANAAFAANDAACAKHLSKALTQLAK